MSKEKDGKIVDGRCHSLTAAHVRDRHLSDSSVPICSYYEKYEAVGKEALLSPGVYSIEELKELGRELNICPYFLARYTVCLIGVPVNCVLWKPVIIVFFYYTDFTRKYRHIQLPLFIRS